MKSSSVVFVSNDGRVGLGLRSRGVSQPLTWAAIGGYQDDHESAVQAAYREVYEELGMRIPTRLEYLASLGPNELFICRVPEPFTPTRLNWENLDFQWKTLSEWHDYRLHPELFQVLKGRVFLAESYFDKKHPFFDKGFPHTKPKMDEWESFMRNAFKNNRKKSFVILNWNKMPESVIRVLLNAPKPKITNSERHYGPKRRESFEK
jgi:8-oxo-dGTP pyrophosphatase MutT (NUDIX family)|tara:strand:- start:155 stop:772 length:618 start_codon:yes stop_codon:yes gene_type:complete